MTVSAKSLIRIGQAPAGATDGTVTSGAYNSFFLYVTADAFATVATAGYFNALRGQLKAGDIILLSAASNKGGLYIVTAAPASGNVTVTAAALS